MFILSPTNSVRALKVIIVLSVALHCDFFQNLSSWKSRRQSQRKSEEGDEVMRMSPGIQQRPVTTTTTSQDRATRQLSNEIEDMVLSAFGFTRAEQQQPQQHPSAVVRSTDLVPASRTHIHSQQPTSGRPRPPDADVSSHFNLEQVIYTCGAQANSAFHPSAVCE